MRTEHNLIDDGNNGGREKSDLSDLLFVYERRGKTHEMDILRKAGNRVFICMVRVKEWEFCLDGDRKKYSGTPLQGTRL